MNSSEVHIVENEDFSLYINSFYLYVPSGANIMNYTTLEQNFTEE